MNLCIGKTCIIWEPAKNAAYSPPKAACVCGMLFGKLGGLGRGEREAIGFWRSNNEAVR